MHNKNYNTKAIVEAGLICSLIVVLMLMTIYVPLFAIAGVFILPIPVTVLYIRHDFKVTSAAVVISAIFIAMLYNPISAVTVSIMMGSTGIALGYCIKNKKKTWFTLLLLALVSIAASVIDLTIYVNLINKGGFMSFINQQIQMTKESMASVIEMYRAAGVSETQLNQLNTSMGIFTPQFIIQLIPSALMVMGFTSACINYSLTRAILKKLRYEVEPLSPFSNLYINNRIGTVLLVLMIIGMLLDRNNIASGKYILTSFEIILQIILLTDGIALAAYYLKNKLKFKNIFSVLIIIFTATSPALSMAYIFAGLMDMIFDFRKLDPYRRKKAQ